MAIVAFLVIPSQGSGPPSVTPPVPETASTIPYFTATFPGQAVIEINDFEFGVDSPVNVGAPTSGTGAGLRLVPLSGKSGISTGTTRDISRRSCVVPIQAFLVIPDKPGNPPVAEAPSADQFFTSSFPNAAVIEVKTFDFAVENATTVGSATGEAGAKARFDELVIRKFVDKASPSLFQASVSGEHFAVVHLFVRHDGAEQQAPFLGYEFQTVFITNIDWSGSTGDPAPIETVTFEYGALKIVYKEANPDGSPGQAVSASWSQVSNSADVADTGAPQ